MAGKEENLSDCTLRLTAHSSEFDLSDLNSEADGLKAEKNHAFMHVDFFKNIRLIELGFFKKSRGHTVDTSLIGQQREPNDEI